MYGQLGWIRQDLGLTNHSWPLFRPFSLQTLHLTTRQPPLLVLPYTYETNWSKISPLLVKVDVCFYDWFYELCIIHFLCISW